MANPIEMLRQRMKGRSMRSLAKEIGCSAPYLSDVLANPPKRAPGPKILTFLGLERQKATVVKYRRTDRLTESSARRI